MVTETPPAETQGDALPAIAVVSPDETQPAVVDAEPAEPVGETPEGEPAEPAAPALPEPFDPVRYEKDESYKEHLDSVTKAARREGHMTAQDIFQQDQGKVLEGLQYMQTGIDKFNELWEQSGLDERTLNSALQRWAPQLGAFKSWNEQQQSLVRNQGFFNGVEGTLYAVARDLVGDEELGSVYVDRFRKEQNYKGGAEAFEDAIKDYAKKLKAKYEAPLLKKLADLETQLEGGKIASRKGGPDTTLKGGSGHKTYTTMTREERGQLTDTQRDTLIAQESR